MTTVQTEPRDDKWLTSGQLGRLWKVGAKAIARYARDEGLPYEETPGGHRRFQWGPSKDWLANRQARRDEFRAEAGQRLLATREEFHRNGDRAAP